ncbi:MAG: non-canonical purine NTP pyrophosphatase [Vampirovibrionales bacterium]|nr:non-canonical purine NTP pyrophosphatase [Vampirovibrionales bacterium]
MPFSECHITIATTNAHKLAELRASFAVLAAEDALLQVASLSPAESMPDVDESGADFAENALLKAKAVPPNQPDGWILAEDTGFEVEALAGLYGLNPFPGLHSNRWLTNARRAEILDEPLYQELGAQIPVSQPDRNRAILTLMAKHSHRDAAFVTAMVLWHPASQRLIQAQAKWPLTVIASDNLPRGQAGFGYDPICIPKQLPGNQPAYAHKTVAELPPAVKHVYSHRAQALQQVLAQLKALSV